MRSEGHGVVAYQHQVGVASAAPRRPHLVQDAGVVLAVRERQQALAHHSSTEDNTKTSVDKQKRKEQRQYSQFRKSQVFEKEHLNTWFKEEKYSVAEILGSNENRMFILNTNTIRIQKILNKC